MRGAKYKTLEVFKTTIAFSSLKVKYNPYTTTEDLQFSPSIKKKKITNPQPKVIKVEIQIFAIPSDQNLQGEIVT